MALILDGTSGLSDVDGTAGTPAIRGSDANTGVFFGTDIVGVSTGGSERMRVDASGNVGIGTSSPATRLHVAGSTTATSQVTTQHTGSAVTTVFGCDGGIDAGAVYVTTNHPLAFKTNNAERARIDSSGNLLVGTTSNYGGGRLDVAWDGTGNAAAVRASSASFVGAGFTVYADRNTTNSTFKGLAYYNVGAGAYKFIVQDSGNVQNTNNSYGAISDIKLKENIVDATPKLAQLNQVRVVNYNLIGDANKQLGVIAQELEQIFPGMVDESPDRDAEGNDLGTVTKSVKYSVFVPMLIKGLQELKAINDAQAQTINAQQTALESLTARVVALEGA